MRFDPERSGMSSRRWAEIRIQLVTVHTHTYRF